MNFILSANWKMHKGPKETKTFFESFMSQVAQKKTTKKTQYIFFPPAVNWSVTAEMLNGKGLHWGAQNVYFEAQGAFTGENSAVVLKELGGTYALVGHSERRTLFKESDEILAKKLSFLQNQQIKPMLCIGETLAERESGQTEVVLEKQLRMALEKAAKSEILVAYEPVWAIGTGKVATPEQITQAHLFIQKVLESLHFPGVSILYGGSVKPENAKALADLPGVSGFLVGGASLEPSSFLSLV